MFRKSNQQSPRTADSSLWTGVGKVTPTLLQAYPTHLKSIQITPTHRSPVAPVLARLTPPAQLACGARMLDMPRTISALSTEEHRKSRMFVAPQHQNDSGHVRHFGADSGRETWGSAHTWSAQTGLSPLMFARLKPEEPCPNGRVLDCSETSE